MIIIIINNNHSVDVVLFFLFLLLHFKKRLKFVFCCRRKEEHVNNYKMVIKTNSRNGILLWLGKKKSAKMDFICIGLINGFPQFSFKLGKQNETIHIGSKVT